MFSTMSTELLEEMPKERIPALTTWVKEEKREWVYNFLREKINEGRQAYFIYPVIEENQDEE